MEFTLRRSYKFLNILFIASMLVPCQSFGMGKIFGLGNSNGGGLAPDMVREIGQALMEGMQSGFDAQAVADGLGNIFDADRASNAFFSAINNQFQGDGQASQAVHNFFTNIAQGAANDGLGEFARNMQQQFQDGGNAQGAMGEFVNMLGRFNEEGGVVDGARENAVGAAERAADDFLNRLGFNEGGRARRAVDDFLQMGADEFAEGGGAHAAANEFFKMGADQFAEGGEAARGLEGASARIGEAGERINMKIWDGFLYGVKRFGVYATLGTAGVAAGWYGSKVFWRHVERQLMRPKLILESSRKSYYQRLKNFILRRKEEFIPMVFNKDLEERLENIVKATRNITKKLKEGKKNIKYRNLLLYGPPGTGKTMFAKQLAKKSGMEFAMMSGSSFAKFVDKGDGMQAMDELFAWAKKSKGLMIFIDEADSFLSDRSKMSPTSPEFQALNNFLNHTGERSDRFMIVMATNHKHVLDPAMWRRIDDLVEVPLPMEAERGKVLALYRDRILFDEKQNGTEFAGVAKKIMNDAKIQEMAKATNGLSNGDLEGIINTIKTDADITDSGLITNKLVDTVVERAVTKQRTFAQQATHASAAVAHA